MIPSSQSKERERESIYDQKLEREREGKSEVKYDDEEKYKGGALQDEGFVRENL